jgi:multiple sugar transport system substrate-binding protein
VHPGSLGGNPIAILDLMASSDEIAYVPLTFGYTNYSRAPAARPILFGDVPISTAGRIGSILGGTGLAISARCAHVEQAAAYAGFVASRDVQRGPYVESGGQPGHRAAWLAPEANARTRDFFLRTLTTLDGAFLRPTDPAWIEFQVPAGDIVHAALRDGLSPRAAYEAVERCYREAYAAVS